MPEKESPNPLFADNHWPQDFLYSLELELIALGKTLPFKLSKTEAIQIRQQHILFAVRRLLCESGMSAAEVLSVIDDDNYGWTEAKNARRFELIDKLVDEQISAEESDELGWLTEQMRYAMKETHHGRTDEAKRLLEEISNSAQNARNTPH